MYIGRIRNVYEKSRESGLAAERNTLELNEFDESSHDYSLQETVSPFQRAQASI